VQEQLIALRLIDALDLAGRKAAVKFPGDRARNVVVKWQ
jgi:hypothetical protein